MEKTYLGLELDSVRIKAVAIDGTFQPVATPGLLSYHNWKEAAARHTAPQAKQRAVVPGMGKRYIGPIGSAPGNPISVLSCEPFVPWVTTQVRERRRPLAARFLRIFKE